MSTAVATRSDQIEAKLDRTTANQISVGGGGLALRTMGECMEFAKLMALAKCAVPNHLRDNPGACLAVCVQAMEWSMSPFAVANKSYVVNDRLSFESQLIHAVIEMRSPISSRLRNSFSGEGATRKCKVWATPKGETEPLVFESSEFKDIQPKNSPLWKSKPDLQLYYNASRDWARMYFPDVILGVYAEDELEASPPVVTQSVERLESMLAADASANGNGNATAKSESVIEADHKPATHDPSSDLDAELRGAIEHAKTLTSINAVNEFQRSTVERLGLSDEGARELNAACDWQRGQIRGSRGGKGQQTQAFETAPMA